MYLVIDGRLALPPTKAACFRDVTLYAKTFSDLTPIIECHREQRDTIWHWLKSKGSFDFVDDLVRRDTEYGLSLGYRKKCNICVTRIGYNNLGFIISRLKQSAYLRQKADLIDESWMKDILKD